MASKQMLAVAVAVAFLLTLAFAAEYRVGDDQGWALDFDYTKWAESNEFIVGDTLVFNYDKDKHSVVEVTGPDFRTCTKSDNAVVRRSGMDRISLDNAGRRWFFCGVGDHCQRNMKLNITILPTVQLAPGPDAPPSPPSPSPSGKTQACIAQVMVMVVAVVLMF